METGRVAMVEVGTIALKANIDQKKPTTRNISCLPRNLGSQAMKLTQTLTAAKEAGKNTKEKACPAKAQTKSTTNRAGLQVASLRTFLLKRWRSHTGLKHLLRNLNTKSTRLFRPSSWWPCLSKAQKSTPSTVPIKASPWNRCGKNQAIHRTPWLKSPSFHQWMAKHWLLLIGQESTSLTCRQDKKHSIFQDQKSLLSNGPRSRITSSPVKSSTSKRRRQIWPFGMPKQEKLQTHSNGRLQPKMEQSRSSLMLMRNISLVKLARIWSKFMIQVILKHQKC